MNSARRSMDSFSTVSRVSNNATGPSIAYHLRHLSAHRTLLFLWAKYNVQSRYSQTWLGIAWIVLLPLSNALVFTFVFSTIFRMNIGNTPFISFFMTALLVWTFFSQCALNGTASITSVMGLINQIYFPREILVLVKMAEAMVDLGFSFCALLVINAFYGIYPNIHYVFLIPVLFIQVCFNLGLMFLTGYFSVVVRDAPQLLAVVLPILFYISPVLYKIEAVPENFQPLIAANPLTSIIQAYRDIILEGTAPGLIDLCYPLMIGVILLYSSYRIFKANEKLLADYV